MEDEEREEQDVARKQTEKMENQRVQAAANLVKVELVTEPPGARVSVGSRPLKYKSKGKAHKQVVTPYIYSFDKTHDARTLTFELEGRAH